MPLLYRDAPLGSIWEGSGNVAALDVLRAIVKEPDGLPAFMAECELAAGGDRRLDAHLDARRSERAAAVFAGRRIPSSRRGGSSRSWRWRSRARCSSATRRRRSPTRSARRGSAARAGRVYGTLPAGVDAEAIIERALPPV